MGGHCYIKIHSKVSVNLSCTPCIRREYFRFILWHCFYTFTITRISEWVITRWRSFELYLCRNIAWVHRMSEISQPKTMNIISTDDHREPVLIFMSYYCWFDVDFNVLWTILTCVLWKQKISLLVVVIHNTRKHIVMTLCIVMAWYIHIASSLFIVSNVNTHCDVMEHKGSTHSANLHKRLCSQW